MKNSIKIFLEKDEPKNKKGGIFESLIRLLLEHQQYKVTQNIHITGLEIDLLAEHQFKNEILYAECKAKEKPNSDEIKKFIFTLDYGIENKKPDYGYFIHTEELDRQAAGLMIRIQKDKKNVSFIGPDAIMKMLEANETIKPFSFSSIFDKKVSKLFLVICPFGYYYVPLLQESSLPKYFSIISKSIEQVENHNVIDFISEELNDVHDLEFIKFDKIDKSSILPTVNVRDTITEVKQSENWFDYTPASVDHFIGRLSLRRDLRVFLDKVRTSKTRNRIFFLDGKSGWGKSSLLAELTGYTKISKYWSSRVFVLAVDTRSANTGNFIGLAFKKLIDEALASNFIEKNIFSSELKILSQYDVLGHQSVKQLFSELHKLKKILVLVFDQFENQFRNDSLFEAFYQFCKDVNSLNENLVVGFSWKSEINIPLGNPAYLKFNQLKDYSYCITIPAFSQNDAKQVIKQLEQTIGISVGNELERRLIESSQGFPWLIKKLCIHTLKQFNDGKTIDELLEEELNYKELFENDLLNLSGSEKKALDYIAKRAYEENPFEISELDKIDQPILDSLIHQRLIIRTGSTYNIYWDIFRDYIVTNEIPVIGESYILRQSGNTCLETFFMFDKNKTATIEELIKQYSSDISEKSMLNVLLELRSLGLIKKHKGKDIYELSQKVVRVDKDFFSSFMHNKFQSYTPIIQLKELKKDEITLTDIVNVLQSVFKTAVYQEKTWLTYARNLVIWIKISRLDLYNRIAEIKKGRGGISIKDKYDQLPIYSPSVLIKTFRKYLAGSEIDSRKYRDLVLFDLIDEEDFAIDLTDISITEHLSSTALRFSKLSKAYNLYKTNITIRTKELIDSIPLLFEGQKTFTSKLQTGSIILSWITFIYKIQNGIEFNISSSRNKKGRQYLFVFGPSHTIDTIIDLDQNILDLTPNNRKKLKDLIELRILDEDLQTLTELGLDILNSSNPDEELAIIASHNENIMGFVNMIENKEERPNKKGMIIGDISYFKGLKESSKKVKMSIYKAWAELIFQYN